VKRLHASCAALLLLACARPATAQVYGQFGGATPVAVDHRLFGLYGGFSDHQSDLLGQLRLSFYPGIDFGFQGGISHLNAAGHTRTVVHMGGDLKTLVARRSDTFPVDVALGGTLGVGSADNFNLLSMGPLAVASRTHTLRGGAELVPYGGVALLYTHSDISGTSSTDASMHVRLGLEARPNADFRIVVELQEPLSDPVDRHPKLLLGANFPF
jgi:hypothetical protein